MKLSSMLLINHGVRLFHQSILIFGRENLLVSASSRVAFLSEVFCTIFFPFLYFIFLLLLRPEAIKILQVTSYVQNPNPAQSHVEFSSSVLGLDSKYEISGWDSRRSAYKEPGRCQIMSIFSSDVAREFSALFWLVNLV
ncbi:hypothetical protein AVEN_221193-1 [Araneus ventricosus]|uniref:Uncharacterized protein n=1 Tax=Araneus ventricosus TaxID=182803 RepID=A0A4Y1ZJU7_ARAVE|nr:hypothetical protein AVEN_259322-1 [Araneus ventricosus]GBL53756.1 hypothetical protein AVEN_272070-1 [Araneus ventricosus]GBL53825.1 hypothetical protein AVEN_140256-1 [Araneus ventricosus]GBL53882.1 hypothetical protein AVEN_221193-1 [Araneus ventricosus]